MQVNVQESGQRDSLLLPVWRYSATCPIPMQVKLNQRLFFWGGSVANYVQNLSMCLCGNVTSKCLVRQHFCGNVVSLQLTLMFSFLQPSFSAKQGQENKTSPTPTVQKNRIYPGN